MAAPLGQISSEPDLGQYYNLKPANLKEQREYNLMGPFLESLGAQVPRSQVVGNWPTTEI